MISFEDGVFSLGTENFSYMLRVTKHGQLEHLHFGAPVAAADVQALACKPGTGWGSSVSYDADGTCLDILPMEWSGSGRGDYRESPMAVDAATDFVYQDYAIHERQVAMACGLPVITTDKCVAGLELVKDGENGYIVPVDDRDALVRRINGLLAEDYRKMGENALETIRPYTIENMVKAHVEIFESGR